jgi:hypothetical protein
MPVCPLCNRSDDVQALGEALPNTLTQLALYERASWFWCSECRFQWESV